MSDPKTLCFVLLIRRMYFTLRATLWDSICSHTPRPHRTAQPDHEGLSRLRLGRCVSGPLASRRPRGRAAAGRQRSPARPARPRVGSGKRRVAERARARTCWSFRPPRPASPRSTPGPSVPQCPPRWPHPLPSLRRRAADLRAGPRQEGGGTRRPAATSR